MLTWIVLGVSILILAILIVDLCLIKIRFKQKLSFKYILKRIGLSFLNILGIYFFVSIPALILAITNPFADFIKTIVVSDAFKIMFGDSRFWISSGYLMFILAIFAGIFYISRTSLLEKFVRFTDEEEKLNNLVKFKFQRKKNEVS